MRSNIPQIAAITPVQVMPTATFPFGASTVFAGNGFLTFPTVPVSNGLVQPISAIGFAAGFDMIPPVIVGGSFNTNNFAFPTAFGPAFAQSQQAPFITVGSNIVNTGVQPNFFSPFFSPFFPVPTPFGVPVVPSPFISSGFGAITVP